MITEKSRYYYAYAVAYNGFILGKGLVGSPDKHSLVKVADDLREMYAEISAETDVAVALVPEDRHDDISRIRFMWTESLLYTISRFMEDESRSTLLIDDFMSFFGKAEEYYDGLCPHHAA